MKSILTRKKRFGRTKAYPGTQAVLRAVSLLKVFTESQPSWSLKDLTRKLKLNKTTLYRLLTALESEGLIARDPGMETYSLGAEMIVMGSRALRSNNLRAVSKEELKMLAEITRETATLEVLSGRDVIAIDEVVGERLMGGVPWIGARWPAFATSTGLSILAHMPETEIEVAFKPPLPQITPKTCTSPDTLRRELNAVRARGYSVAEETLELGFIAIGAAIFNHEGEVAAAVSIGGPRIRLTPDRVPEFGSLVRDAARRISTRLGFRNEGLK